MATKAVGCDMAGCEEKAVQRHIIDGGQTVDRCEVHAVPAADVGSSWTPVK